MLERAAQELGPFLDEVDLVDGTVVGFGRDGSGSGSGDEDRVDEIVLPRLRALADQ